MLPDFIEVVVPDDEVDLYSKVIPNPLVAIPKELKGLGPVRNWCINNFKEETVIMLDDDISRCYNIGGLHARGIKDKEELLEVLINTAIMAKDAEVGCFGYTQTDIRKYRGTDPFTLCTWVGGVIGVIGKGIQFRNDKFKVDIDFCLQNLMINRIVWCDNRYYFLQARDNNGGGNSLFRNQEEYEKSCKSLQEKWGSYIKIKNDLRKGQLNIKLNVQRKQKIDLGV